MSKTRDGRFIGFDRLKQSVTMEQVLARYGLLEQLRRRGDNLSGVCPLHQGHNPAQFQVSLTKNCWFCFGDCQSGGSIVDFVARKEGLTIREAGLLLQDWFMAQADHENDDAHAAPDTLSKRNVRPPPKHTNALLGFTLRELDAAHPYLVERGLRPQTIHDFGLGYCSFGSLRDRIAIPIHDAQGRLIAHAGRWPGNPPDGQPKYRLPRGFCKSIELFNQHRAANESGRQPLVVVEGFFGCMALWQTGHRRVVSIMGSLLSPAQGDRIVELVGEGGQAVLFFDGDAAGRKGCARAKARLEGRIALGVVQLPDGGQPDSLDPDQMMDSIGQAANQAQRVAPFRPVKEAEVTR